MSTATPDATPRTPTVLAAELYLVFFPLGHLLFLPVGGAMATAADVALLVLLAAWGVDMLANPEATAGLARAMRGEAVAGLPSRRILLGFLLLLGFGVWVAVSGTWSFHARYAAAKGTGLMALALGAAALATSGMGWRRAAQAWLAGTLAALAATMILALVGSPAVRERLLYGGAGVLGLPFPRVSGPFLHPNMLGDYLVVSALLLWGIWPEIVGRKARAMLAVVGVSVGVALVLTTSTAWVGAGVAAIGVGRLLAGSGRRGVGAALRLGGLGLAGATCAFLVLPLDVRFLGLELVTGGIRPAIWQSALTPFLERPLWGVGASPYVAEALDPLKGGMGLWDAHNAFLSILGQFGLVGFGLAGAGVGWVVAGALGGGAGSRRRTAVTLALLAVAVNALFMASEDLRHVWALLGMVGLLGAEERG